MKIRKTNLKQKKAKEEEKAQLYFFFNCFFNVEERIKEKAGLI